MAKEFNQNPSPALDARTRSKPPAPSTASPAGATEPVLDGRTPLRVWCVPGKEDLACFALAIGAFSLDFFERYYGLPYPGDKVDLLAIPDFASGAMENLGAITFRENALLVDEAAASHRELERIAG